MNITNVAIPVNGPSKRIKCQYVTAVASVALALSGAIAVGSGQGRAPVQPAQPVEAATSGTSVASRVPAPQEVYYLVSSQAEADRAAFAERVRAEDRALINAPEPKRGVHTLLAATGEQESAALHVINEDSRDADGVEFYFLDLREDSPMR